MWQQNYIPLGDSLAASALVAGLPIFTLLLMLGVLRKPAWMAGLTGLATAMAVALFVYGMPASADGRRWDVWVVPADGSAAPQVLIPHASSPSVVRGAPGGR